MLLENIFLKKNGCSKIIGNINCVFAYFTEGYVDVAKIYNNLRKCFYE